MNIIIVGASDIGIHLASLLSQEQHGIVLIDLNPQKLEIISRELDIATKIGSGTDWMLLEELYELNPNLILALTEDDETNLATCAIAKNLGYPITVARIRQNKFLNCSRINFERIFCVDYLISPEKITAEAIANMILTKGISASESFSHGAIKMRTLNVPSNWKHSDKTLAHLQLPENMMIGLIRRKNSLDPLKDTLLFPHGSDFILPNDEITLVGETESMENVCNFFDISSRLPESLIIIGGSLIGINLAQLLEHKIRVKIIEKDYQKCRKLSTLLPLCTVINQDGTDIEFLKSEKIGLEESFVACTRNDETNLVAALIGKELGCENVIVSLSNTSFIPLIKKLGINHVASPRIHATNRILSIAREKTVASMISMYDNHAEIMEVKVSMDSKIAGIPLKNLGPELPKDFLIAVIQSRGRIMVANGNRILSPGDTVIVISSPRHIEEIKKLF